MLAEMPGLTQQLLNEPHPGYIGLSSINNWVSPTDCLELMRRWEGWLISELQHRSSPRRFPITPSRLLPRFGSLHRSAPLHPLFPFSHQDQQTCHGKHQIGVGLDNVLSLGRSWSLAVVGSEEMCRRAARRLLYKRRSRT
jgi:hypothetical protein